MANHAELKVRLLLRDQDPTGLLAAVNRHNGSLLSLIAYLVKLLPTVALRGNGLVATVRGFTCSSAYGEFTVAQASATAGDKIQVITPDGLTVFLTAKASGSVAANGEFDIGASDTAMATNIAAAWNAYPPTSKWATVTNTSGTVKITARGDALVYNNLKLSESVTNSAATSLTTTPTALGSLTNGVTPQRLAPTLTQTVTIGAAPTANDTLRWGGVVLTWKASAANENEVTLNANTTTSATNLKTAINAHSILGKLVTATSNTNVVTLTWSNADVFLAYMLYCVATGTTPGTISAQFQSTAITPTISATPTAWGVP